MAVAMEIPSRATPSLLEDMVGIREEMAVGVMGAVVATGQVTLPPLVPSATNAGDMGTML